MTQLMRKLPIALRLILRGPRTDSLMSPPNSLFCMLGIFQPNLLRYRYECEVSVGPVRAQVYSC